MRLEATVLVVHQHRIFGRGGIGVNLDILVADEDDDVGDAAIGTDDEFFVEEFFLAADLDVLVGLERSRGWNGTAKLESALERSPVIGEGRGSEQHGQGGRGADGGTDTMDVGHGGSPGESSEIVSGAISRCRLPQSCG